MAKEQKLPPVTAVAMASLALVLASGIYLSSHLPEPVSLTPAVVLLVLSAVLTVLNLVWLARVKDFAWFRFWQIARWSLLAYAVIASVIGFVFIRNHVSGNQLVVLIASLIVYTVQVPTLTGFTVARYYTPPLAS